MRNLLLNSSSKTNFENKLTLLYVDANESTRKSAFKALSLIYKQVHVASNYEEAIAQFFNHSIDLVITDKNLKSDCGLELIHKIKQLAPRTPCVVTLCDTSSNSLLDLISHDIHHIVVKPFDMPRLIEEINKSYEGIHYYHEMIKKEKELEELTKVLNEQLYELKELSTQIREQNSAIENQYEQSRENILGELGSLAKAIDN